MITRLVLALRYVVPVFILSFSGAYIPSHDAGYEFAESSNPRASTRLAASGATIAIVPNSASLIVGGDSARLEERISNLDRPLGAFELSILYDRGLIQLEIQEGSFLGSTGRTTSCDSSFVGPLLKLRCTSTGSAIGPAGDGVLAVLVARLAPSLRIRPTLNNGIITAIVNVASQTSISDAAGAGLSLAAVSGAEVTISALEGDFNGDCRVDVLDLQDISRRYQAPPGVLLYDRFFDVEPTISDDDIDIKDLQFAYARNGNRCPAAPPAPSATPTITPHAGATSTPMGPRATSTVTPRTGATSSPTTPSGSSTTQTPRATTSPAASGPIATPTRVSITSPSNPAPPSQLPFTGLGWTELRSKRNAAVLVVTIIVLALTTGLAARAIAKR